MKVWITKHALSQGIYEADVEISSASPDGQMVVQRQSTYASYYHGEGMDWHRTLAGAQKRANEMAEKKIKNLKKQLAKLENMVF